MDTTPQILVGKRRRRGTSILVRFDTDDLVSTRVARASDALSAAGIAYRAACAAYDAAPSEERLLACESARAALHRARLDFNAA